MLIKIGQPCSLTQQDPPHCSLLSSSGFLSLLTSYSATCPHPTTPSTTFPDNPCPPQGHVPSALPSQLTLAPEPRASSASCFRTCPGPGTTHRAAAVCSPAKERPVTTTAPPPPGSPETSPSTRYIVRVLQRSRTNRRPGCLFVYHQSRFILRIVETGKFRISSLNTQGGVYLQFEGWKLTQDFHVTVWRTLPSQGTSEFSLRAFNCLDVVHHILGGVICFTQSPLV